MNPWIALIIGLLLGWLIELLIDIFYWRKRRLCPDDDALSIRASLEQAQNDNRSLQASLDENKTRLGQLEADLAARDGRIATLTADLDARAGEIDGLNGRIHQLEADLTARDNELETIRTELGGIDVEAQELGFGSIFSGAGLALGSFWHQIKNRFSGLHADVAARDSQINDMQAQVNVSGDQVGELKAQLASLETDLAARNAQIGDLRVELDAKTGQLGKLETELDAKNVELGRLHTDLGDLDTKVKGLGLGSLFAGGGLTLSGFFANLKDRFSGEAELETRSAELDASLAAKDAEIDGLRLQVTDLEQKLTVSNASLVEMRSNLGAEYKGAQGLSMVWGMNTAASNLLANRGIYTYNQLAATKVDEVNDAIELSGEYYPEMDNAAIHGSWVEQSRLAGSGDWDDLFAYQQQRFDLVGLRDDLKKIWGIGPKIEQVLNENGVYLFAQLASVPPDRITEILRRAGSRFQMSTGKLHESWPEQARLADKGDWDAFQTLQDTLDWSKVQGK
ncbi:MAG: hypothetical protein H6667_15915 [Ardenticatenaceae bacterium]|nr:hypothetical protein [Ardenticatenaceae bacterium]MCB9443692.1 hypothetical protein [Ardenticatenaceae bacterium]